MKSTIEKSPRLLIAAGIIPLIVSTILLVGCSSGNEGFWNEIELGEVDLDSLPPGTYIGEYEAGPVKAVVSVELAGGRIQDIEILEHRHLLGRRAEQQIPSRVLSTQSVQVDTITRATASSMVILKAIEIALSR
jgi:uncharacterized protein with FMN-binding domain